MPRSNRDETAGFKSLVPVGQDPDDRVPDKVLATHVRDIAASLKKLSEGPLTEEAIAVLVHAACPSNAGVSIRTVRLVLEAAYKLESKFIKKGH